MNFNHRLRFNGIRLQDWDTVIVVFTGIWFYVSLFGAWVAIIISEDPDKDSVEWFSSPHAGCSWAECVCRASPILMPRTIGTKTQV